MSAPKPHDPRVPQTTPQQIDAELAEILAAQPTGLAAETEQLEAAHDVLHRALQKN